MWPWWTVNVHLVDWPQWTANVQLVDWKAKIGFYLMEDGLAQDHGGIFCLAKFFDNYCMWPWWTINNHLVDRPNWTVYVHLVDRVIFI